MLNKKIVSANLAELVYAPTYAELYTGLKQYGFKFHKTIDVKSNRIVIAQQGNTVYIAFRGTANKRNVLTDARFFPAYTSTYGWTHRGFVRTFERIEDALHTALLEFFSPNVSYVFLGHSLGGALSQLCALWFADKFTDKNLQVISFGCPKVGFGSFRSRMRNARIEHYRFHNDDDPVTHVPGKWFYKHYDTQAIEIRDDDDDYFWDTDEHSMELYKKEATEEFVV